MTNEAHEEIYAIMAQSGVSVTLSRVHYRPDGMMGGDHQQIHHLFTVESEKGTHAGFFSAGIGVAWRQWEHKREKGVPRATLPHPRKGLNPNTIAARDNDAVIAKAYRPTSADIVVSMVMDYTDDNFETWASEYGYEDSIEGLKTYNACRAESVFLEQVFTREALDRLRYLACEL